MASPDQLPATVKAVLANPTPTPFEYAVATDALRSEPVDVKILGSCALEKHQTGISGDEALKQCQAAKAALANLQAGGSNKPAPSAAVPPALTGKGSKIHGPIVLGVSLVWTDLVFFALEAEAGLGFRSEHLSLRGTALLGGSIGLVGYRWYTGARSSFNFSARDDFFVGLFGQYVNGQAYAWQEHSSLVGAIHAAGGGLEFLFGHGEHGMGAHIIRFGYLHPLTGDPFGFLFLSVSLDGIMP